MKRKYEKTDAPPWQRKVVVVVAALFGATLLLFVAWAVVLFLE